ncbi:hypothetical protein [Megamonas hypermegale]|uniref:hypothetical protein n=1 Tax=Megamonas hypermegale TaxID=158847 RepID=UPI0026F0C0FA|nr:hypothetical protein [Megamonas hypermegale]
MFQYNHLFLFIVHFSFGKQKKNEPKRKLFNVSLPLHWASLRSSSMNIGGTTARNVWNLARAFYFQQELKFELLILQFATHAETLIHVRDFQDSFSY